jgi:NTE family protein
MADFVIRFVLLLSALTPAFSQETGAPSGADALPIARPVVALVLSGGGALGLAHIGVIRELEARGIPVDIVVGTSMGAIVGGFYAIGYSPADMERFSLTIDWTAMLTDALPGDAYRLRDRAESGRYALHATFDSKGLRAGSGLLSGQNITGLFERATFLVSAGGSFDSLPRRYRAVAADILTGETVILDSGSIADAMRASMTIPGLFSPFKLGDRYLVDGGMTDKLPVHVAREMGADIVIAVETNEPMATSMADLERNPAVSLNQAGKLMIERTVSEERKLADIVISPNMTGLNRFDFGRSKEIILRGERAARSVSAALDVLAARILATRKAVIPRDKGAYFTDLRPRTVAEVRVRGGDAADRAEVEKAFAMFVGTAPGPEEFTTPMDRLYATGRFKEMRIRPLPTESGGTILDIELFPLTEASFLLNAGFTYYGSYNGPSTGVFDSNLGAFIALTMADMTGHGSAFKAEVEVINPALLEVSYRQPLGSSLSLSPFGRFFYDEYDNPEYFAGATFIPSFIAGGGLNLDLALGPVAAITLGYGMDWVHAENPVTLSMDQRVGFAGISAALDGRDDGALPRRGASLRADYRLASPYLGGAAAYQTLSARGDAFAYLWRSVSLGLVVSAATNFGSLSADQPAVLSYGRFALSDRRLFPGITQNIPTGDYLAAAGVEAKIVLVRYPNIGVGPLLLVTHAAAGDCVAAGDLSAFNPFHAWDVSAGLGINLTKGVTALVRAGAIAAGGSIGPYVALDLGALAW